MKIKTSELIGPALDCAVAKCEGATNLRKNPHVFDPRLIMDGPEGNGVFLDSLNYSTCWNKGGPIIERERICIYYEERLAPVNTWRGYLNFIHDSVGPTPLIAAMRCYVASKLGDEVEIPDELI